MTGWLDRVRGLVGASAAGPGGGRGGRVTGDPPSGNGASSFHLFWDLPGEFAAVSATVEVVIAPTVPRLYFWALQASFVEAGRHLDLDHLCAPVGELANAGRAGAHAGQVDHFDMRKGGGSGHRFESTLAFEEENLT